jgi:hypothetical protein
VALIFSSAVNDKLGTTERIVANDSADFNDQISKYIESKKKKNPNRHVNTNGKGNMQEARINKDKKAAEIKSTKTLDSFFP